MAKVQLKSLASQQMNRDRVAGEGIHHEHLESLWRFLLQGQSRITQDDVDLRFRVAEKAEILIRDLHNHRIDLIKLIAITRSSIGCKRASPESDHSHLQRGCDSRRLQGYPDAGVWTVIGGGLVSAGRRKELQPVIDRTVHQLL